MAKTKGVTVRLSDSAYSRLQAATRTGPYEISITVIIERGIELAAQELERMAAHANPERP